MSRQDDDDDYEVGYGKPPKASRFRKGESGNPKGRPKGAKSVDTMVRDALLRKIQVAENGVRREITVLDAILKRQVNGAVTGDGRSTDRIMKLLPLVDVAEAREAAATALGDAATRTSSADLEILQHFFDLARRGDFGTEDEDEVS